MHYKHIQVCGGCHIHRNMFKPVCVHVQYLQLCPILSDPLDCSPPGSSVHRDFPGKNIGVSCHTCLQGIFLTQGWNPGLPCCRQILYPLSYPRSPWLSSKSLQVANVGEDMEKRKPSYTVGKNMNWCSHYGKQYGDSSKE